MSTDASKPNACLRAFPGGPRTLRLVWPQWQGAGRDMVARLFPEVPLERARFGYSAGARVLEAILPKHAGPTEVVPVSHSGVLDVRSEGGIESRRAILDSLDSALASLGRHDFDRVLTLGGECSVSVAPFSVLVDKYGDDLAVVWIDSHPDVGTPESEYDGYHAMAVSTLLGYADADVVSKLPAVLDAKRVALAGLHEWTDDDYPNIDAWGLAAFGPAELRDSSAPLLGWLRQTGASKVAVHFDVDAIDSDELTVGLGRVPGGLTGRQIHRLIEDLSHAADVVGLTTAEFIPRQALALTEILWGLPLLGE